MRQKANPGLLSVNGTFKPPPAAQRALAPEPQEACSLSGGWVGSRGLPPIPGWINPLFLSMASSLLRPQASEKGLVSRNPAGDQAARSSPRMERRRRQPQGSRVPPAGRWGRRGFDV